MVADSQSLSEAGDHIDAVLGRAKWCTDGKEKIFLLEVLLATSDLIPTCHPSSFTASWCVFPECLAHRLASLVHSLCNQGQVQC